MEKARSNGAVIGRPPVAAQVDTALVVRLRSQGKSWAEITKALPFISLPRGHKKRPSPGSIRRAYADACQKGVTVNDGITATAGQG